MSRSASRLDHSHNGMQVAVTESELEDLRRKFHLLEGDRKAYYEMSMHTMKSNKVLVQQLRDENKELRKALAALQRESRAANEQGMTTDQQELEQLARNVNRLRRQHDQIASKATEKTHNLRRLQDKAADLVNESKKPLAENTPTTRHIRNLENRLDKAMIKFNEAQSIRKTYDQIVKRLKEERVGFDNQLAALERTLAAKDHDYQELKLLSSDAAHARDVAQTELERVRNTYQTAKRGREKDLRTRNEFLAVQAEQKSREAELLKRERMIVENASKDAGVNAASIAAIAAADAAAKKEADEKHAEETIDKYESAFRTIKEATGVSDINEVIHKILNQEDTQGNLMGLTKENQVKMDDLKSRAEDLKAKVDELRYSGSGATHKRKMVDDHEESLTAAAAKLERAKGKYERLAMVLINAKAGVQHLNEKLSSQELAAVSEKSGPLQTNDETVVEVLYQCESTLVQLMQDARARAVAETASSKLEGLDDASSKKGAAATAGQKMTNFAEADEEMRELYEARPYNQRVALPAGDSDTDMAGGDLDDDMDNIGAADEKGMGGVADEQLTREKIKRASIQVALQHDRATRKKGKSKKHRK